MDLTSRIIIAGMVYLNFGLIILGLYALVLLIKACFLQFYGISNCNTMDFQLATFGIFILQQTIMTNERC